MADKTRLKRLADRLLLGGAGGLALLAALLLWFCAVRRPAGDEVAYWLPLVVGGLAVLGSGSFPWWRQRVYQRVPAPKLLGLVGGVLIPLVVVELGANLLNVRGYLYYARTQRYFQWQRYTGVLTSYRHPVRAEISFPWGRVTTNSEGWRSPEVPLEPPPGTYRVLGLGDSVLFSWGVEQAQTLSAQVEAALPVPDGFERVEVLNTGHGSFTTLDELLVLKERGLAYKPHAAFLLVISNDFSSRPAYSDQVRYLEEQGTLEPGLLPALRASALPRPGRSGPQGAVSGRLFSGVSYLLNRSFLLVQATHGFRRWDDARPGVGAQLPPNEEVQLTPAGRALLGGRLPFLNEHTQALKEVARSCRAAEIPLVVFLFARNQDNRTDQSLLAHLRESLSGLAPLVDVGFPQGTPPQELQNSPTDPHWNPRGTAWFGGEIARALGAQSE